MLVRTNPYPPPLIYTSPGKNGHLDPFDQMPLGNTLGSAATDSLLKYCKLTSTCTRLSFSSGSRHRHIYANDIPRRKQADRPTGIEVGSRCTGPR